jgi:NADPH:quinone reductase-like Zn-dependent oxidoreductase
VVCSTAKTELVRSIGADHVIDYRHDDFSDGAKQWDLILDTAGNRRLSVLRRALKPHGTRVIVGGEGGGKPTGDFERYLRAAVLSLFMGQKLKGLLAVERAEDLRAMAELIEAGKVFPVIDRSFALDDAPAAIEYMHEGKARGKVVITI